ncbi:hypothetical protein CEXT_648021 [Caerostris extrusa]|uniref:Uncharacterized protein n=1 Tax=Caerostris extrusa TaxID=172846 RepID=A0AAV4Q2G6_CAEEX|nr:hypothetical protein CEXT_648021 [Caerostris extrusa]
MHIHQTCKNLLPCKEFPVWSRQHVMGSQPEKRRLRKPPGLERKESGGEFGITGKPGCLFESQVVRKIAQKHQLDNP